MSTSWHMYWAAVRERVEADPELRRLQARRDATKPVGSPAYRRRDGAYQARYRIVEEQARFDQTAAEVDQERAAYAAYMREYRAGKRAVREAVDARRSVGAYRRPAALPIDRDDEPDVVFDPG